MPDVSTAVTDLLAWDSTRDPGQMFVRIAPRKSFQGYSMGAVCGAIPKKKDPECWVYIWFIYGQFMDNIWIVYGYG